MNIIQYVKKWGQTSFHKRPIGEVDSLILSALTYLKWDNIAPSFENEGRGLFLGDISLDKKTIDELVSTSFNNKKDRKLLLAIIHSPRFSHLKVNYFQNIFDEDKNEQFAAITYVYDDFFIIAFRGTDKSLIGWKEDFEMAILDEVPAQKDALIYATEVYEKLKMPFYLSGHSKGGNLSIYVATHMSLEMKNKLIFARSHDGPGFRNFEAHIDDLIPILNKTSSTVPVSSLVGTLLGFRRDSKIVEAKSFFVLQHLPYNWKINKRSGDFVYLTYRSKTSYKAEITISRFIHSLNDEEKRRFINIIFEVLKTENNSLGDIINRPLKSLWAIRKKYRGLSEEDKKFVKIIMSRLRLHWREALLDPITYKKLPIKKAYHDFTIFDEWQ